MRYLISLILFSVLQTAYADSEHLRSGAMFFMNYCSGCHSLNYMRYEQLSDDLGLTGLNPSIFHGPMKVSMPKPDAMAWFGRVPPDLSLTARVHGSVWIYQYLSSFYSDTHRPFGANNKLVVNVAMPNVFAPLTSEGMSQKELSQAMRDVVYFLNYVSEPVSLIRYKLGAGVLLFLGILWLLIYALKTKPD